MAYWGKVIGGLAGLATGRPWMAIIGLILGHQFDRGFGARFARFGPDTSTHRLHQLSPEFVRSLFELMGHLAKADGRVTAQEIRAARAMMHRLGLGAKDARQAINWFEQGKDQGYDPAAGARRMMAGASRKPDDRALFVSLLTEATLAKSSMHRRERSILWSVCVELDISRVEFAQMEAVARAHRTFGAGSEGAGEIGRIDAAYRVLGVDRSSTNEEIKKAYRRLMNKNHPDKIASVSPDKEQVATAERKTREVRNAYEMLKVRRSIR